MPEISLFYGIRVTMYYDDHNPPHFHAEYNGNKALIEIDGARVIKGALPSRQLKLILAWCVLHQDELMQNWELSKDINIFIDTCTVLNDTLAWDVKQHRDNTSCLDIDPDTLYELPNVKERIAYFFN